MVILLCAALPLISCQESDEASPEVQKYERQSEELDALSRELTDLRVKVAAAETEGPEMPVEKLRAKLAESQAELNQLNEEFEALEVSEKAAIKALEEYKAKYPL